MLVGESERGVEIRQFQSFSSRKLQWAGSTFRCDRRLWAKSRERQLIGRTMLKRRVSVPHIEHPLYDGRRALEALGN